MTSVPGVAPWVVCALLGASLALHSGDALASVDDSTPACAGTSAEVAEVVTTVFGTLRRLHRLALPGADGVSRRDRQVSRLVLDHIGGLRFTSEVLRGSWEQADAVFHTRWPTALTALLHRRFLRALRDPLQYDLNVGEVAVNDTCDGGVVQVKLVARRRARTLAVTLSLELRDGAWLIWDVQADGVSLVKTWRSRFAQTAKRSGFIGLDNQLGEIAKRFDVPWPPLPEPTDESADGDAEGGGDTPSGGTSGDSEVGPRPESPQAR